MARREVPDSPPIDFTVYGLRATWPAIRWFNFFDGELGRPTYGVRFGHQAEDSGDAPYVCVATLPRDRFDQVCVIGPGADRLTELASYAAFMLTSLTFPVQEVPHVPGLNRTLVEHGERAAADFANWPSTTWTVGVAPVRASLWRFAGGWTAFCDELPDSCLVAAGWGVEPEGLEFDVIDNGMPYGIDLDAPLGINVLSRAQNAAGPTNHSGPNRTGYHPDQLMLRGPGS
ncbi:MAG TPA: hypothetical protein VHZ97_08295 [Pseudonocardiaceae bacterium]|jgi:hypothetical protein|nr:hypothetical protein [Pseudonocardiaceae bacterium]